MQTLPKQVFWAFALQCCYALSDVFKSMLRLDFRIRDLKFHWEMNNVCDYCLMHFASSNTYCNITNITKEGVHLAPGIPRDFYYSWLDVAHALCDEFDKRHMHPRYESIYTIELTE